MQCVFLSARTFAASVVLTCLTLSRVSAADPTGADIEKLIKSGTDLRKSGKDQQALPFFQKAYDLTATPRTAAQLGLCEMQLGYWVSAESHLAEALAGRSDPWLAKHRTILDQSLHEVRAQLGELIVEGVPADAEVSINGHRMTEPGRLPIGPVRVVAGRVKVELRAPGYIEKSAMVVVTSGARTNVKIVLEKEAEAVERPTTAVASTTSSPFASSTAVSQESNEHHSSTRWSSRQVVGTVLGGSGILAFAAGAGLLVIVDKRQTCGRQQPGDECDQRVQARVPGWSLLGAGVAASAVGAFLFFGGEAKPTTVGIGPSSLVLSGHF